MVYGDSGELLSRFTPDYDDIKKIYRKENQKMKESLYLVNLFRNNHHK